MPHLPDDKPRNNPETVQEHSRNGDNVGRDKVNQRDATVYGNAPNAQGSNIVSGQNVSGNDIKIINYYYHEDTQTKTEEKPDEYIPCPYRGLYHFTPQDSEFFFGRDVFIEELYNAVQSRNFVAVLGASGSGKSSVVFAGLVPRLVKENHWLFTHFRPGADPFLALAMALVPLYDDQNLSGNTLFNEQESVANSLKNKPQHILTILRNIQQRNHYQKILIIGDQFEELYTLCKNIDIRSKFLNCLIECLSFSQSNSSSKITTVITMRADFLGSALGYRTFADRINDNNVMLGAMDEKEIRDVIVKPAENKGVSFQDGLVERIFDSLKKESESLPLLEFALTLLWEKREGKLLTHKVYEDIEEVKGALANYAETIYKKLSEKDQKRAQRVFIQLVRPGEGTEDTRRLATRDEVGEKNWDLVTRLASMRLMVTGRGLVTTECDKPKAKETVEIIHEALIIEWPRLRSWMEDNREFRTWQEDLKRRIQEWKEGKGELLSKTRLRIAEEWRQTREQEIGKEEKDFISNSLKEHEKQLKNKKILWWSGGILSTLFLVVVSILGTLYVKEIDCDVGKKVRQDCLRFIITSGDRELFVGTSNSFLQQGVKNFSNKKFKAAEQDFENAKESAPYDPIPQIYENNAKARHKGNPYKLGVVVPVDAHEEVARNMLRGVAYAQNEFNNNRKKSAPLLEIIIANDKNNQDIAKGIASRLVKKNILGVIGHRSSNSSLAAIGIYYRNGISMVSPVSGSTNLDKYVPKRHWVDRLSLPFIQDYQDKKGNFIRAVASNKNYAEIFYEYAKKTCLDKEKKVWILYDNKDEYSQNLREHLSEKFKNKEHLYEISFDELLEKRKSFQETKEESEKQSAKEKFKNEIKEKIDEGVRCAILIPSTKTTAIGILVIYAYQEVSKEENFSETKKIEFMSGLAIHNNQTLKKDGSHFDKDLVLLLPINELNIDTKECPHHGEQKSIQECIRFTWGGNISWRVYTSYHATKILTKALEKLDIDNEKLSTSDKREKVLDFIKRQPPKTGSCLMSFNDMQENKLCDTKSGFKSR